MPHKCFVLVKCYIIPKWHCNMVSLLYIYAQNKSQWCDTFWHIIPNHLQPSLHRTAKLLINVCLWNLEKTFCLEFETHNGTTNGSQTKSWETIEFDEKKTEDSVCLEATFSNDVSNMFSLTPAPFRCKGNIHHAVVALVILKAWYFMCGLIEVLKM